MNTARTSVLSNTYWSLSALLLTLSVAMETQLVLLTFGEYNMLLPAPRADSYKRLSLLFKGPARSLRSAVALRAQICHSDSTCRRSERCTPLIEHGKTVAALSLFTLHVKILRNEPSSPK